MPADLPDSNAPLAEISQGPSAFEQFLDRNQKNLIILAVLIALGTGAYVVYSGIEESKQITAGNALNKAEDLASLQSVVSGHPATKASQSAMILLADKQWTEGQQDAAIGTLRTFINANPNHPGLGSAKASLGAKLMAQGKSGEAATVLQELADDPAQRFAAPFALIALGDMARAAGDTAKAETFYNKVKTDFSSSSYAQEATKRAASLKAKAPVEIAPPPAPKPEEKPVGSANPAGSPGITVTPAGSAPTPAAPIPAPTGGPVEPSATPPQENPAPAGSESKPESSPAPPKP